MRKQYLIPAIAAALTMLTAPASHAGYSNTVMALNPVAYWPLNETTQPPDPVALTASNLGTLGSAQDATFTGDPVFGYPGALASSTDSADSFNGFNARATAPYSSDAESALPFTIEAWILAHDNGTLWGTTCVLSDVDANSPRSGWLIYMDISNLGQYTFRTYNQNGTTASLSLDLGAPGSIEIEKWYHLAIVVSNAVTVTNVYAFINGALVAGPVVLPGYVPNDGVAGAFTLGDRSDNTGYTATEALDEVAYYTNALDAAVILAHYQAGTNPSPATPYSTLVQQSHPALYYRMDEAPTGQPYPVALPVAVNHGSLGAAANGFYQSGTSPGLPGPTNSGFGPVSVACGFSTNSVQSSSQSGPGVMCAPFSQTSLNFNEALSITAWIQVPAGDLGWFMTTIGRNDESYRFDVDTSELPHFAANPNSDLVGPVALNDGIWHFWAGVVDPVASKYYLYIDGLPVAQGSSSPLANLTCYVLIGGAPDYLNRNFVGDICHVAMFTNALSAEQIASLYGSVGTAPNIFVPTNGVTLNEGANGSFTASVAGTTPLNMQWYYVDTIGNTNVATGQTTATLSFTNVQASLNGYQYFLTVSNAYGAAVSSLVTVTVAQGPPTIQVDLTPASEQVPVGVTVGYEILVTGSLPFHYQWFRDGSAVSGATASAYSFPAQSGSHTYSCTVTNNSGPVNSALVTLVGVSTPPPVITFNVGGTGWTVNGSDPSLTITNGTFLLTDGANGEVSSVFFNTPQYNGGFAAFFTYQEANGTAPLADGTTFCVQNSSAGASALGGGGGELGFFGIDNSSAFEINIYNGAHGGIGIQFGTNGMTADSTPGTAPYFTTSPLNVASTDPINVQLFFSQGVYHLHLVDATTGDSFLTTYNQGDMRSAIGADTAYVGFTGATGGLNSIQTVSNFRFSYTTPPVLSAAKNGTNLVLSWPVSVATFFKLQQSSAVTGPYTNVVTQPVVVGLQNQVTVPATGAGQFYRLDLQ
jgi:hypothetical protein